MKKKKSVRKQQHAAFLSFFSVSLSFLSFPSFPEPGLEQPLPGASSSRGGSSCGNRLLVFVIAFAPAAATAAAEAAAAEAAALALEADELDDAGDVLVVVPRLSLR